MANWQRQLNVKEEWRKAKDGELPITELARIVADKLAALEPFGAGFFNAYGQSVDEEKDEIIEDLRHLAQKAGVSADEFDEVWNHLYNWADTDLDKDWPRAKVCWVAIR